MTQFRIGTRGSPLALVQAHMVRSAIATSQGWSEDAIEIVIVKTTGDKVQDRALAEIGGKALWTKELDRALLAGEVDACVHSMKDVETLRPAAIAIAAMLPRADVRDRLIGARSIADLREGAVIGTSSPRRAAQLGRLRPDLQIVLLRGNVDTRLGKVADGSIDATLLAAAGLDRLGRSEVGAAIEIDVMLPAPAQGAVGIEVRREDAAAMAIVGAIGCAATIRCVSTERALLAALNADCHSPVGALATIADDQIHLRGELLAADGSAHVTGIATGNIDDREIGARLASDLLGRAPAPVAALFRA